MSELVSIIIPVFNRDKMVEGTVTSILNQSYKNWECIIVDDHSSDRTFQIIEKLRENDGRIILRKRPTNLNKGACSCRNYGLSIAKGSFINFLDSDDKISPDFIQEKVNVFKQNEDLQMVISVSEINNSIDNTRRIETRTLHSNNILTDYIVRKRSWYIHDPMIRHGFLESNHKFDETLLGGQDRDFFIKVLTQKPMVHFLSTVLATYNRHENSISRSIYSTSDQNAIINASIYKSLIKQIQLLMDYGLFNSELQKFYFHELIKKLPAIIRTKGSIFRFYKSLFRITKLDIDYLFGWFKVILAQISFFIFNKGERLLR